MYRIDNLTAIPYLPTTPPSAAPGFFTDGNPAAALEATVVDAWWLNQLQEEILTVTDAAGIAPDKGRHDQMWEALQRLFLGIGAGELYLPLSGGALSGFLTLHANPTLEMHAATKLYVDQVMGGIIIPPVGDYLPLTGGTLYRPGGADILMMQVDEGHMARMLFNVLNTHMWGVGAGPGGVFEIGDWNVGGARLTIDDAGMVAINGSLWVGGPFSAPSADIPGNLVVGGDLHVPSGGSIFASGSLFASATATIGGALDAGGDIVANGSLRGWAAIVQSDVVAGGGLTSQGATISGLTHTDRLLTNNDATIGTTLLVNGFATISGAATIGGVLRANGNRILSYGGNNPTLAMVNAGAAPGYGMWVGGNPGRLTIGTVDTAGNPLANLVTLDGAGNMSIPGALTAAQLSAQLTGVEIWQRLAVNGPFNCTGATIAGEMHSDTVRTNAGATVNGALLVQGGGQINNGLGVSGNINVTGAVSAASMQVNSPSGSATITFRLAGGQTWTVGNDGSNAAFGIDDDTAGRARLWIDWSGQVGIDQNMSIGTNLAIGGWATKPGGGEWTAASDARLKKDVRPYERGLAEIRRLRPIAYQFNGLGGMRDEGIVYHGLVAQEAAEIMPEMVGEQAVKLHAEEAEDTPVLTLDCTALKFALVNAVKELAGRIEALETRRTT